MRQLIAWFELAAWLSCLFALPRLWKKPALRVLPFLLTCVVLVDVYQAFFPDSRSGNVIYYNGLAVLLWFGYSSMLVLALRARWKKGLIGLGVLIFLILSVSTWARFQAANQFNIWIYCSGAIVVVMGTLLVFYEMLHRPIYHSFLRDPFFYLLFALLLFSMGTLPYFTMSHWLYYDMDQPQLVAALASVSNVLNYVLYGTYTAMFVWIRVAKDFSW